MPANHAQRRASVCRRQALHHWVADHLGGQITHAGEMWNYAAGFPHPFPHFEGHGLSTIPCKSALWLNHRGERIGPEPLVTGFDTHWLCQRVAEQEKPWTWHLLNWRIAAKEFAISGAEHNQRIRDMQFPSFLKETLLGNHRLVKQMHQESRHFLVDDTLAGLAAKMNALTASHDMILPCCKPPPMRLTPILPTAASCKTTTRFAAFCMRGSGGRTSCAPATSTAAKARCRAVYCHAHATHDPQKPRRPAHRFAAAACSMPAAKPVSGLYCVGEAAGFGGGGASGKRSLEGTFLPGCILTGRAAARHITAG
jgi:predicted oxidoreductase